MCYTYILKCSDGTFYTGWTNDLDKRLKAHNGGKSGGKNTPETEDRSPWFIMKNFRINKKAMRREYAIKQLTRKEKEALIAARTSEN